MLAPYDGRPASERQLVGFVRDVPLADVPDDVLALVRHVLGGSLATAVAGAGEEGIAALRQLLRARGGTPEATSLVFGDRLPAVSAALLNAAMARALDFCDAIAPGAHIGTAVVPAALAAAEAAGGCDGATLLRAVAVGCEVGARCNLTEAMYDGFDPTGIAGVFAATAAAAAVYGLDHERIQHAFGLALNRCGGSFQSHVDGSLAVRLQQGIVAQAALESVQYAIAGLTGPANFLEGVYGYTHLYARGLCRPAAFVDGLGDEWRMRGFMFKKYPSCGVTQGVTQLTLDTRAEMSLAPDDIARVVVTLPPYCHRLVGNPFVAGSNPRVSAQFSVRYCVASALARGTAGLADFRPRAVLDPTLAPLIEKVDVVGDPALDLRGHSSVDVEFVLADGRTIRSGYDVAPGYPGNDLTEADHRRRFDDCMAYAEFPLAPGAPDQLRRMLATLEAQPEVGRLFDLLRAPLVTTPEPEEQRLHAHVP